jgi:hypothetical protein
MEYVSLTGDNIRAIDDGWIVENNFGETGHYARITKEGVVLTKASRGGLERFVMSSGNALNIERYMTSLCGSRFREVRGLAPIEQATNPKDISQAARVTSQPGMLVLTSDRSAYTTKFPGPIDYADIIIWFSHIMDAPLDQLRESFLDPDGMPLFPDLKIGFR